MKRTICLILSVVLMGVCIIPCFAKDEEKHPADLLPDKWEDLINSDSETTLFALSTYRAGDINADGAVSSLDARKCLIFAAGLEEPQTAYVKETADVNCDGQVDGIDARIILQAAAKLRNIDTEVETIMGDGVVVGPLQSSGGTAYFWQCEVDKPELKVLERTFDNSEPEVVGGAVNQYFAFTPEAEGTYTVNFKLANAKQTEVLDEFTCIVTVK